MFKAEKISAGVLTPKERDVALLLKYDLSFNEMAGILCVSRKAVEIYVQSIFKKCEVGSRKEFVTLLIGNHPRILGKFPRMDENGFFKRR